MTISYPNDPVNGQEFNIGNKTLVYNGAKWVSKNKKYYQYGTEITTTGPTLNIDLTKSNSFSINLTEQAALSFINPPSSGLFKFTLKVNNNNVLIEDGTTTYWDIRNITQTTTQTPPTMDTALMSFAVSSDGKKSLFLGNTGNNVYQLDMNANYPWEFSSTRSSYNTIFLSLSTAAPTGAGETAPWDLFVDPSGKNLFVCGLITNTIFRYNLPNAWSLSGASTTPISSFALGYTPYSIFFNSDGTRLYVMNISSKLLYQYPLIGSPYDITQVGTPITRPLTIEPRMYYFRFKPDGTKLYILGDINQYIYQYSLSTPWDISTMTFDAIAGKAFAASAVTGGFVFKPEGDFVYAINRSNNIIQVSSITSFRNNNVITWPSNIVWQNNIAPELPDNQKTSIYEFTTSDGGATYYGKMLINNV